MLLLAWLLVLLDSSMSLLMMSCSTYLPAAHGFCRVARHCVFATCPACWALPLTSTDDLAVSSDLSRRGTAVLSPPCRCAGTPRQKLLWALKVWQALQPSLSPFCGRLRLCLLGGPWQSSAGGSPLGRSQVPSSLVPAASSLTAGTT